MTGEKDEANQIALNREIEDTIHQVILACGLRPLKEKVSILYLTIDYIFEHNKDLNPNMGDKITIH